MEFQPLYGVFKSMSPSTTAASLIALHNKGVDFDNQNGKKALFKISGEGKDWAQGVDSENSNYDYLSTFSAIFASRPPTLTSYSYSQWAPISITSTRTSLQTF